MRFVRGLKMHVTEQYGFGWVKGETPDTSPNAVACDMGEVKNARVIEVKNAKYRHATLNGKFLLKKKGLT